MGRKRRQTRRTEAEVKVKLSLHLIIKYHTMKREPHHMEASAQLHATATLTQKQTFLVPSG
jgi:hypothetical protein